MPARSYATAATLAAAFCVAGCLPVSDHNFLDGGVEGGGRLFEVDDMYPGSTASSVLSVTNNSPNSAAIGLRVTDVVDADNGCTPAEARVDGSCDGSIGELGGQVVLTVESLTISSGEIVGPVVERVLLGSLGDEVVLQPGLGAGGTSRFRFTLELPVESGNETQTDSVKFTVEIIGRTTTVGQSPRGEIRRAKDVAVERLNAHVVTPSHSQR